MFLCRYGIDCWGKQPKYDDSWNEKDFEDMKLRCSTKFAQISVVNLLHKTSHECHPFQDKADVVYLDANCSYESLLEQLTDWFPVVRDGGFICGGNAFPLSTQQQEEKIQWSASPQSYGTYGVLAAITNFFQKAKKQIQFLADYQWIVQK
jgi:hypothetical protein